MPRRTPARNPLRTPVLPRHTHTRTRTRPRRLRRALLLDTLHAHQTGRERQRDHQIGRESHRAREASQRRKGAPPAPSARLFDERDEAARRGTPRRVQPSTASLTPAAAQSPPSRPTRLRLPPSLRSARAKTTPENRSDARGRRQGSEGERRREGEEDEGEERGQGKESGGADALLAGARETRREERVRRGARALKGGRCTILRSRDSAAREWWFELVLGGPVSPPGRAGAGDRARGWMGSRGARGRVSDVCVVGHG